MAKQSRRCHVSCFFVLHIITSLGNFTTKSTIKATARERRLRNEGDSIFQVKFNDEITQMSRIPENLALLFVC